MLRGGNCYPPAGNPARLAATLPSAATREGYRPTGYRLLTTGGTVCPGHASNRAATDAPSLRCALTGYSAQPSPLRGTSLSSGPHNLASFVVALRRPAGYAPLLSETSDHGTREPFTVSRYSVIKVPQNPRGSSVWRRTPNRCTPAVPVGPRSFLRYIPLLHLCITMSTSSVGVPCWTLFPTAGFTGGNRALPPPLPPLKRTRNGPQTHHVTRVTNRDETRRGTRRYKCNQTPRKPRRNTCNETQRNATSHATTKGGAAQRVGSDKIYASRVLFLGVVVLVVVC